MKTTKLISTIAYNTPAYLELKLQELLKGGKISFYAFISHLPEDDEGGKKHHAHVIIEPAKLIQTDDIKEHLKEFDPAHPDKPLGCISFRRSEFDDWYLYAIHDKAYLASKGESRKYHYYAKDFISNDYDDLTFRVKSIDRTKTTPYNAILDAQSQGLSFQQFFKRGSIPLPQIALWERAWYLLQNNDLQRNGHDGHEPPMNCNTDTGEVTNPYSDDYNTQQMTELSDDDELPF